MVLSLITFHRTVVSWPDLLFRFLWKFRLVLQLLIHTNQLLLIEVLWEHIVLRKVVWHDDGIVTQLVLQWNELVVSISTRFSIKHAERVVVYSSSISSSTTSSHTDVSDSTWVLIENFGA